MKAFTLIFRTNQTSTTPPTQEQMNAYMESWMKWINNLSKDGKLANGGNSFIPNSGRVIEPNNKISDGIYVANNQSIAGYIVVFSENIDEAILVAKDCPILNGENTSVEIRENNTTQEMKDC